MVHAEDLHHTRVDSVNIGSYKRGELLLEASTIHTAMETLHEPHRYEDGLEVLTVEHRSGNTLRMMPILTTVVAGKQTLAPCILRLNPLLLDAHRLHASKASSRSS